ncbi:pyridoxamine 5'-phosphate oxidase family protein [Actinomadura sp. KC345]|uniref:pyridoxamine 5'-phosphate oxidase family protein n=1 Tax=Actinomadura sp. KC345 TaxID=2530371 RepID=UPI0010476887|nr:pyridoxamine 5'-phosphate oxidase family protein [Actinomadura sp. KC345]TDC53037.1 pyridoxamine 5'-phosphate oxidase family protein [Actinomadura sp. KC345]
MKDPLARLDERFSDPDARPVPWAATAEVLESAQLFWITTVRSDGRPHVTPLVGVWLDQVLHFTTGREEQKALNLNGNPQVALITGCNRWDEGLDVIVEGVAERVTTHTDLERLAVAWEGKWDGQWRFQAIDGGFAHAEGGEALVFAVRPSKILAFSKGTFGQTRYIPAT